VCLARGPAKPSPAGQAPLPASGTRRDRQTGSLLAATTTAAIPGRRPAATWAGATPDSIQLGTWEWEGGQDGTRSRRAATSAAI
jgi:hypothetical protein